MPPTPATPAKPTKPEAYTPWSYSERGMRSAMADHIKQFKPEGTPDPIQLENARTFALAELAALPAEVNFVRVTIEVQSNPRSRQTNIIFFPETVHA